MENWNLYILEIMNQNPIKLYTYLKEVKIRDKSVL